MVSTGAPRRMRHQREASGKYNGLEGTAWLTTSLEGAIKLTAIEVVTTGQGNDVIGAQILAHQSTFGQWILNHHQLFITLFGLFRIGPEANHPPESAGVGRWDGRKDCKPDVDRCASSGGR